MDEYSLEKDENHTSTQGKLENKYMIAHEKY